MTPQERFAHEHDAPIEEVRQFARLGKRYAEFGEHECNGDPHPHADNPSDKNENAKLWGLEGHALAAQMTVFAESWGFHHLDFGVGFYPTLQTGESDSHGTVMFPWDN